MKTSTLNLPHEYLISKTLMQKRQGIRVSQRIMAITTKNTIRVLAICLTLLYLLSLHSFISALNPLLEGRGKVCGGKQRTDSGELEKQ